MFDFLVRPWHWSVAGLLIGLTVPVLLLMDNKKFGISSAMRHICAACFPSNLRFFNYDWRKEMWNLFFVAGMTIGGGLSVFFINDPDPIRVSQQTVSDLRALGVQDFRSLMPADIFNWGNVFTFRGLIFFVLGGFLIGFGSRYAGGCTSGHSIMGLSTLQWPSLVATICFMAGGFLCTHLLYPFIFKVW